MLLEELLTERFANLFFNDERKEIFADQVWEMLQRSYKKEGGLKGNGFGSKEEMIRKIPFWKLKLRNGVVKAATMYKDKNGRKLVALGYDGTPDGRLNLVKMIQEDVKRSFVEVSGRGLLFLTSVIPDWQKYALPVEYVRKILPKDNIIAVDNYRYQREIGGSQIEKIMLGTPHLQIKR
jgi:hypothetical protein